jgi:hypothetical protein
MKEPILMDCLSANFKDLFLKSGSSSNKKHSKIQNNAINCKVILIICVSTTKTVHIRLTNNKESHFKTQTFGDNIFHTPNNHQHCNPQALKLAPVSHFTAPSSPGLKLHQ